MKKFLLYFLSLFILLSPIPINAEEPVDNSETTNETDTINTEEGASEAPVFVVEDEQKIESITSEESEAITQDIINDEIYDDSQQENIEIDSNETTVVEEVKTDNTDDKQVATTEDLNEQTKEEVKKEDEGVSKEETQEEVKEDVIEQTQEEAVIEEVVISYPEFNETKTIDNVNISIYAPEGVFPEGSTLSVNKVSRKAQKEVDAAINEVREEEKNVVTSYTFDIKVLDKDGNEIQPNEKVKVSFALQEVTNENLETTVYHIPDTSDIVPETIEVLEVITEGEEAVVETGSFSYYTVEFTYNGKQYVLEGDTYVKLEDVLSSVGLSGEVTSYEISNPQLFNIFKGNEDGIEYVEIYDENGDPLEYYPINNEDGTILYILSLQPFTSEEWLKVTIDGIEYEIVVTDAIRVNENGDQVSTSVRYISTTNSGDNTKVTTGTNSAITDSRVIQGPTEENFTASMPLAEIYIDDTIVNQTLWGRDEYNGTRVIAELLVDNTQGKYKGFKINTDPEIVAGNNMATSYGALYYDFSERYFNDTQTLTVSGSSANNYEKFSGDIVRYTLKGMATKFDPVANEYKNYDVVITYSDLLITLAQNSGTGSVNQANISDKLMLIDTNMVNFKWSGGFRAGLEYNVNVKVVDPDTGELIDGSYYYPMTDIDVGRTGIGGFANLYNAANVSRYSEQVALLSNYGRPTSSGSWEQKIWIPGGNWSAAPVTNLRNITDEAFPYTSKISSKTIDGQANTLVIEPSRPNGGMTGAIAYQRGISPDNHDNSFYSGFITLANNTAGGINVKGYASAPTSGGVETYVLTGSQIVNHKVDSSSNVGGTIFTTTTGNADGKLSGGTLLGYDKINTPFELSAATGQSVTYTMTPKGGYKLSKVWVKDTDIDIMSIVNTAKATINESDFDENNDGTIDENERANYEIAVNQAVDDALSGQDAVEVPISDLQSLGKGIYAYTFNGIQTDKSIHIEWEKTDLIVTKELNPTMSGITDKFKFQIKLSDTSTEETTWRVRAKKNTGKISYINPYFPAYLNSTYYFGYHEGHTETLPYAYVQVTDTTDKNPYEEGWYVYQNGAYMPSYDSSANPDTTYYEIDDTQTSTITNYYYHLLGWNDSTNEWEEKVIPATSGITDGAIIGIENLDNDLPDYHRYNFDGTVVNNENYYNEETGTYDKYLMWIPDTTTGKQMLVVGNTEEYPDGTPFSMSDYYAYIYQEGIENYSGKVLKGEPVYVDIDGVSYKSNFGGTGYWYTQDDTMPIYYNLINNSNGYNLDSGYTPLEGESGMYIITLPAGQNPKTDDLTTDGWDVTVSRVGAIPDDFDLDQAMANAGARSVAGAVNTYEFELGVDESIDFNGVIPMGWNYEITEILPDNSRWRLLSSSSNATINDFDGDEDVTFTNTEKKYDVTIEKQTVDNKAGTFDFTIEIYKEEVITPAQIQTITIQAYKNSGDSNVTYKLTNSGNPIDIAMNGVSTTIPTGDSYLSNGGSIGTLIGDLITLDNTTPNSIVMNGLAGEVATSETESLYDNVQALVNEGYTSFSLEPVAYTLSTPDITNKIWYTPSTVPTGFNGTSGTFTFTLSNNESKTFADIPYGHKYEIKETVPTGWENVDKINEVGTLTSDVTSTWTNDLTKHNLKITKETVNNETGSFSFKIKIWKDSTNFALPSEFGQPDANGYYTFTLTNDSSKEVVNIPYGYSYEIYELDASGNTVSAGSYIGNTDWKLKSITGDSNTGTITDDVYVNFTNELVHDLTITKGTTNNIAGTFNFKIKAWKEEKETVDEYIDRTEAYAVFNSSDGSLTFFRDEKNKYINNQVDETKIYYTGIEATQWPHPWRSVLNQVTAVLIEDVIKPLDMAAWFSMRNLTTIVGLDKLDTSNTISMSDMFAYAPLTSLDLSTFDTSSLTSADVMFADCTNLTSVNLSTFNINDNISISGMFGNCANINTTLNISGITNNYSYAFANAATANGAQITLKYVAPATSADIDTIISSIPSNSSNVINGGEGVIASPSSINYDTSNLGAKNVYLDLTQYGNVTVGTNNEYTFSLNNGGSLTLSDLPHGTKYEVYEETKDGWTLVSVDGNNPTVSKGAGGILGTLNGDTSHTFNNMPLYSLEVIKKVSGNMGNKSKKFEFEISVCTIIPETTINIETTQTSLPSSYIDWAMNYTHEEEIPDPDGREGDTILQEVRDIIPVVNTFVADKDGTFVTTIQNNENVLIDLTSLVVKVNNEVVSTGVNYGMMEYNPASIVITQDLNQGDEVEISYLSSFTLLFDKYNTQDLPEFWYEEKELITTVTSRHQEAGTSCIDLTSYGGTVTSQDGVYKFELAHNDSVKIIDIPYGYTYSVKEKDYSEEGYKTEIDDVERRTISGTMNSDETHTFRNINGVAIPTEVRTHWYFSLFVLIPLAYFLIKRKKTKKPVSTA